jgi:surfeit locus 1 family protein
MISTKEFSIGVFTVRINWLLFACVVLTILAFGRLGLWQLDRAAEKVNAQQVMENESKRGAEPIESIPRGHLNRANPELQNRHVALEGEFLNDKTILLLGQFHQTQIGYGVVTPFRLSSNNQLVLVSRGWTSAINKPGQSIYTAPVEGPVSVTAQIYVPSAAWKPRESEIDGSQWPVFMRDLEIDIASQLLGEEVWPFEVRLTADQEGALVRHWPAVSADVDQNLSYALQWFCLALLVFFASLFASSNLWALLKGPERGV